MCILLHVDLKNQRQIKTIDIHYLNSGGTNFSFVTRLSITPARPLYDPPKIAFSADGSKFAIAMTDGRVSVWNIQSKVPLQTFAPAWPKSPIHRQRFLQFSTGNLGKEILVFVEVRLMFTF